MRVEMLSGFSSVVRVVEGELKDVSSEVGPPLTWEIGIEEFPSDIL